MYSDTDILQAIDRKDIIIYPFNAENLGVNSYDVSLGNAFFEVHWDDDGPYFVGPQVYLDGEKVFMPVGSIIIRKCIRCSRVEETYIPTGGTLLGMTKELITTHGKVVGELRSRSSTRRVGITTNCDAGLGDIGYADFWTMEFSAFVRGAGRPFLVVGQPVAQMIFFETNSAPTREYEGQYTGNWPYNMIPRNYRDRIKKVETPENETEFVCAWCIAGQWDI